MKISEQHAQQLNGNATSSLAYLGVRTKKNSSNTEDKKRCSSNVRLQSNLRDKTSKTHTNKNSNLGNTKIICIGVCHLKKSQKEEGPSFDTSSGCGRNFTA